MVPAGGPTEKTVQGLAERLEPGDIMIDGGNSYFKDDVRRSAAQTERHSLRRRRHQRRRVGPGRGYCMMIGGPKEIVAASRPDLQDAGPGTRRYPRTPGREVPGTAEEGYLYCGPSGAGHFVKMVHNGIEYGLMQAYAEGFDIFRNATARSCRRTPLRPECCRYRRSLAARQRRQLLAARSDRHGADGKSHAFRIHRLCAGFRRRPLDHPCGIEEAVPADVLSAALFTRFRSRQEHTFAEKMLSAMRQNSADMSSPAASGKPPDDRCKCQNPKAQLVMPATGRNRRRRDPCVMVIFGAAGDLTSRKLFPALYNLAQGGSASR